MARSALIPIALLGLLLLQIVYHPFRVNHDCAYLLEGGQRLTQTVDATLVAKDGRFLPPPGRRASLIADVEAAIARRMR